MDNITYLFGAGASANALPVVNQIPNRIQNVISELRKLEPTVAFTENYQTLIENLKWLKVVSENHASIDTYAKKLFVRNETSVLDKLKHALSIYFVLEQCINKADNRYDSFFAALLNSEDNSLPKNIRILSWNYDSQFEIAFSEYSYNPSIYDSTRKLNFVGKFLKDDVDTNKFGIYKINGSAAFLTDNTFYGYSNFSTKYETLSSTLLNEILQNYTTILKASRQIYSALSFAWERDFRDKGIIHHAIEATKNTTILVVIGYSFPFFNREIDRKIIKSMPNLRKVYFQSPEADNLKDRFLAITDKISNENLKSVNDTWQFYLPNEL